MSDRPILFNTEMVQAILYDVKTQTRRIIKGLPLHEPYFEVDEGRGFMMDSEDGQFYALENFCKVQPRDVLWVRETWQHLFDHRGWRYEYKADYRDDEPLRLGGMYIAWRPSIHMPKAAARLFLFVKHVRAERLQDITMDEIKAEGLTSAAVHAGDEEIAFKEWELLWNSTIKKEDLARYGWDANPWVWVIEFERMDKPSNWA